MQGAGDASIPPLNAPASPASGFNNGNAETGVTTGWTTWGGTLSATSSTKHGGSFAIENTGRTATWQGPMQDIMSSVYSGQEYFARVYATVSSGTQNVYLTMAANCGGTTSYTQVATATVGSGSWASLQGNVTMPSCTNLQSLKMYVEGPAPGVDLIVDDAVLW